MGQHVWHHWFYSEICCGYRFLKRHAAWNMGHLRSLSISVGSIMPLLVPKMMYSLNKVEVYAVIVVIMSVTVVINISFCWVFVNFTFKMNKVFLHLYLPPKILICFAVRFIVWSRICDSFPIVHLNVCWQY
jgi:uncharacterized protein YacL